jgi:hypothetical protein
VVLPLIRRRLRSPETEESRDRRLLIAEMTVGERLLVGNTIRVYSPACPVGVAVSRARGNVFIAAAGFNP